MDNNQEAQKTYDRVNDVVNKVVNPLVRGAGPIQMQDGNAYRLTGDSQINDLIETGYMRARENGSHGNQVFWTKGKDGYTTGPNENRNLVVVPGLQDGRVGAVGISEIDHIYKWDNEKKCPIDIINEVNAARKYSQTTVQKVTHEEIAANRNETNNREFAFNSQTKNGNKDKVTTISDEQNETIENVR